MDKASTIKTFNTYAKAATWAHLVLNISKPRISEWLHNQKPHSKKVYARLDSEMPKLAAMLESSHGECVNNARAAVRTLRRTAMRRK